MTLMRAETESAPLFVSHTGRQSQYKNEQLPENLFPPTIVVLDRYESDDGSR